MNNSSFYIRNIVDKWQKPGLKIKVASIFIIAVIFTVLFFLLYHSSVQQSLVIQSLYVPVIISAIIFRTSGGIIAGLIAAMILSPQIPELPLDIGVAIFQETIAWGLGAGLFILVGIITGSALDMINHQYNQLQQASFFSPSTELPNKYNLLNKIEWHLNSETSQEFTLFIITIENATEIINNIGHNHFGNFFKTIASNLSQQLELSTDVYNIYENNIAILLTKDSEIDRPLFINRLISILEDPIKYNDIPIYLDTFIGAASYPDDGKGPNEIFQKAYIALNKAQKNSQTLSFYDEKLDDTGKSNLILLGGIKPSLDNNHFELHYQPKIDLKTNEVVSAEALIRWHHPEIGMIPPGKFIPQIEKTALINELTCWVFDEAAKASLLLNDAGLDLTISINVAPRNLQCDDFLPQITKILTAHAIEANSFELELTETDLVEGLAEGKKIFSELAKQGFKISLDDFGTGYSSLAYLKELDFDYLKIDRSFVDDMLAGEENKEIVSAAITLGHILKKEVIAEGVENKDTLDLLKEMDCDYAQGYYFSKPKPLLEFMDYCTQD